MAKEEGRELWRKNDKREHLWYFNGYQLELTTQIGVNYGLVT